MILLITEIDIVVKLVYKYLKKNYIVEYNIKLCYYKSCKS